MKTNPMRIPGAWREGYVLDYHTISSEFMGYDENGNKMFDNRRSDVGELLYQLKYRRDQTALPKLVRAAAAFIKKWAPGVETIVPVPPTRVRRPQPVIELALGIGKELGIAVFERGVRNVKNVKELKNVFDYGERIQLLDGAYHVDAATLRGKPVLLFDDLYRSGATLNAVTRVLYEQGACADVYAFALTRTRTAS